MLLEAWQETNQALDLIWKSNRAESTRRMYCYLIRAFLDTGGRLTSPGDLSDFAGTLTNSMRMTFKAAVGLWAREMISQLEATVTPASLAQVQATTMRLHSLTRSIKVEPQRGQRAHTWLTAAQVQALFDACGRDLHGRRDRVLLGILVCCGLRRAEAINLRWDHIVDQPYKKGKTVAILNVIKGKGSRDRAIPLSPELEPWLDRWAALIGGRDGYVVRPIRGYEIGDKASREVVQNAARKRGTLIGLPNLRPHDCRRTFAQTIWQNTKDLLICQELLGHSSPETTRRYLRIDQERTIDAVLAIEWGES